jgi:hypothetical protein
MSKEEDEEKAFAKGIATSTKKTIDMLHPGLDAEGVDKLFSLMSALVNIYPEDPIDAIDGAMTAATSIAVMCDIIDHLSEVCHKVVVNEDGLAKLHCDYAMMNEAAEDEETTIH